MFHDLDRKVLATGVPTNTWLVGTPVYDLEYADDTLWVSFTPPQMEEFLRNIQVEATLYGRSLNLNKTENKTELLQGTEHTAPVYLTDGTQVS